MIVPPPPVVLAYGIGVDSTALLIELHARGQAPDLVLTADTGNEKPATYATAVSVSSWSAMSRSDSRSYEGVNSGRQSCTLSPLGSIVWSR